MICIQYFTVKFLILGTVLVSGMSIVNPGPKYPPTKGEVWPKPQKELKESTYHTFDYFQFKATITNFFCETLSTAVARYVYILKHTNGLNFKPTENRLGEKHEESVKNIACLDDLYKGHITELKVVLTSPCEEYPSLEMDERYNLKVSNVAVLESASVWGILRGLETFVQLFYVSPDYTELVINATSITDYPSYPHRGLLLDTSRHYIRVDTILKMLDAMAMNKMNVFHWHIVDDQSFPYQSEKYPELSDKGAYHSLLVYTKEDIAMIVQYARDRGIRVIPEFDIPGHTRSWGVAYPNILTKCYSSHNKEIGLGPMDPLSDDVLDLLMELIAEVQERFPDKFFHMGGDEVDLDCWNSNPRLRKYMRQHSMSAKDLHALFMRKAIPLLGNYTTPIVWQDVFDEKVPLSKDTIVQVWKDRSMLEMIIVLLHGYRVLFSADWYLGRLQYEWTDYYTSDPRQMVYDILRNETLLSNIVGGEACMWGEMADDRNVISRVWPRASAVAEKLWHSKVQLSKCGVSFRDIRKIPDEVYNRIEEHTCRMVRRGIDAQPPSGPGFCVT